MNLKFYFLRLIWHQFELQFSKTMKKYSNSMNGSVLYVFTKYLIQCIGDYE
jgi:hypothetical protein